MKRKCPSLTPVTSFHLERMPSSAEDPAVRISSSFRLGGVILLQAASEEDADTMLKLIAGILITDPVDEGSIYVPPFLTYSYLSETPVLVEVIDPS